MAFAVDDDIAAGCGCLLRRSAIGSAVKMADEEDEDARS